MAETKRVLLLGTLDDAGLRRVLQAAARCDFELDHARPEWLGVRGNGAGASVWRMGEELARPHLVLHQNMKVMDPLFCLLETWERHGVLVLNSTLAGHANISKWSQQERFEEAGIPHPHTDLVLAPEQLYRFAEQHGFPFIVKPALSSGEGASMPVGHVRHIREIEANLDGRTAYVAQQFVSFEGELNRARDRKAVVVDGRIVTVMERTGNESDVVASHFGKEDTIALETLRTEEVKYVCAAVEALGMAVSSVDYWLTADHPEGILVNEVNGFPALPPREAAPFAEAVVHMINEKLSAQRGAENVRSITPKGLS